MGKGEGNAGNAECGKFGPDVLHVVGDVCMDARGNRIATIAVGVLVDDDGT